VQHVLECDVQVNRPLREALRHLAGADHAFIESKRAGDRPCPFRNRLDEALDTAEREPAIPLMLNVEVGILTQSLRLARHHDHRDFILEGPMNSHAALQHPYARMQEHSLQSPRHQRVSGGHIDGERFVP
jgi:hypothetical protein